MSLLEHLQPGEQVFGYMYNRIVDALSNLRSDNPSLINSYAVCWGYQPVDSLSKARCRFWITPNVTSIIKVYLSFTLQPFHVGNQTTAQTNSTTSGAGSSHNHSVSGQTTGGTTSSAQAHNHNKTFQSTSGGSNVVYDAVGIGDVGIVNASATVQITDNGSGSHSHVVSAVGVTGATSTNESVHTHTVSIPSVTLNAPTGIYEAGMASGTHVFIDGVDQTVALGGPWGVGVAIDISALDITQFITTTGWHELQLSSAGIGGITTQVQLQSLINSAS